MQFWTKNVELFVQNNLKNVNIRMKTL